MTPPAVPPYRYVTTRADAVAAVAELRRRSDGTRSKLLAVDFEWYTTDDGGVECLRLVQLAVDGDTRPWLFDIMHIDADGGGSAAAAAASGSGGQHDAAYALRNLLGDAAVVKVVHDARHDALVFGRWLGVDAAHVHSLIAPLRDTQLMFSRVVGMRLEAGCDVGDDAHRRIGLAPLLGSCAIACDPAMAERKRTMHSRMDDEPALWRAWHIGADALAYAADDVRHLIDAHNFLLQEFADAVALLSAAQVREHWARASATSPPGAAAQPDDVELVLRFEADGVQMDRLSVVYDRVVGWSAPLPPTPSCGSSATIAIDPDWQSLSTYLPDDVVTAVEAQFDTATLAYARIAREKALCCHSCIGHARRRTARCTSAPVRPWR